LKQNGDKILLAFGELFSRYTESLLEEVPMKAAESLGGRVGGIGGLPYFGEKKLVGCGSEDLSLEEGADGNLGSRGNTQEREEMVAGTGMSPLQQCLKSLLKVQGAGRNPECAGDKTGSK
jgi:hypothetical protein